MVWIASAITAQLSSKSAFNLASFNTNLSKPFKVDKTEIKLCPRGTPILLKTVESVKSRCNREIGNLADKCSKRALAMPKLPSEFSKSMGFTLCGIADDPISPSFNSCLK